MDTEDAPVAHERSGTVTIMFVDSVGSTRLIETMGDDAGFRAIDAKMTIASDTVAAHNGSVVKSMGDGIMAVFPAALDALACAVATMRQTADHDPAQPPAQRLQLRISLNAGDPIRSRGDYYGMPVLIAARLRDATSPGQILATDVVRTLAGTRGDFTFRDIGSLVLRSVSAPVHAWDVCWDEGRESAPAAFAAGTSAPSGDDRPLAHRTVVILFTDIVDSTPLTESIGDNAFRLRARQLDRELRRVISEGGGSTIEGKLLGDGVLAMFPSARSAIDAAVACHAAAQRVELQLHAGIHAGDVLVEGNTLYGGAANIASRYCAASAPGQILVSDVVRGLARTSSGVRFKDLGAFDMKGVADPQRVFEVVTA